MVAKQKTALNMQQGSLSKRLENIASDENAPTEKTITKKKLGYDSDRMLYRISGASILYIFILCLGQFYELAQFYGMDRCCTTPLVGGWQHVKNGFL